MKNFKKASEIIYMTHFWKSYIYICLKMHIYIDCYEYKCLRPAFE